MARFREACFRHASYYEQVARRAGELYLLSKNSAPEALNLFDAEWHNILVGQAWSSARYNEDIEAARLCSDFAWIATHCVILRLHVHQWTHWLEMALGAARRLGDRTAEANILANLGSALLQQKDSQRATEFFELSLPIMREIHDRIREGQILGNLGLASAGLGQTVRAIEFFKQALLIAGETGDRAGVVTVLGNLGLVHAAIGDFRQAIELSEEALLIVREVGDPLKEGRILQNLGVYYATLNLLQLHPASLEYYKQALAVTREIGDRQGQGSTLFNISRLADRLGHHLDAIEVAKEALKLLEDINSPDVEKVREQLAQWGLPTISSG